jgi:hypothetical protein
MVPSCTFADLKKVVNIAKGANKMSNDALAITLRFTKEGKMERLVFSDALKKMTLAARTRFLIKAGIELHTQIFKDAAASHRVYKDRG